MSNLSPSGTYVLLIDKVLRVLAVARQTVLALDAVIIVVGGRLRFLWHFPTGT